MSRSFFILTIIALSIAPNVLVLADATTTCSSQTANRWVSTETSGSTALIANTTKTLIKICEDVESAIPSECRMHALCSAADKFQYFLCAANDKSGRIYSEWTNAEHMIYARDVVYARCMVFSTTDQDRAECLRSSQSFCLRKHGTESLSELLSDSEPPNFEEYDFTLTRYSCSTFARGKVNAGGSSDYFGNKDNTDFFKQIVVRKCILKAEDPIAAWPECAKNLVCNETAPGRKAN